MTEYKLYSVFFVRCRKEGVNSGVGKKRLNRELADAGLNRNTSLYKTEVISHTQKGCRPTYTLN